MEGNLSSKTDKNTSDVIQYIWDSENQLTRVITSTDTVDFRYDALGRRIAKIVNGGIVNRWFWDGAQLRAEQVGGSIRVYDFDPTSIDLPLLVTGPASVLDGTSGVLFFQRDRLG